MKRNDEGLADEAAFAQFVAGARLRLARTAWLLTGSSAEAEDLVQEALVLTYVAWRRAKLDDPMAYARRVLVNRHIDRWRRARREIAAWTRHGVEPEAAIEAGSGAAEDRDVLVRLLQGLSRRERATVVLRYYFDLPEQQVARELGVSVGTVKSTASRALKRLREEWPGDWGQLGAELGADRRADLAAAVGVGPELNWECVEVRNGVSGR